jgi:magnesium-transporting ATPase (P-type)
LDREKEESQYKLVDEITFDSERKLMTTIRKNGKDFLMFTK